MLDAQGNPVPNARVEAVSAETSVRRTTVAGADGRYTLTFPEGGGRYTVRASAPGQGAATMTVARASDEEVLIGNFRLTTQPIQLEGITARAVRPAPGRGDAGGSERAVSSELASRLPLENATDPAQLATLVLPGSMWCEEEGTTTNLEGRVQRRRKAITAPGAAREDWRILCDLAAAVGSVRETVTKVVGELSRQGAIHAGYGKISLTSPAVLRTIAGE